MQGTREEKKQKKQSTFKMDKNTSKHHIQDLIRIIKQMDTFKIHTEKPSTQP